MRYIHILDDATPEATAMLQALYSRDPRSVVEHLERVRKVGPEKFMGMYYVGYGHKSIGDCGTTTLFIEQVSMFAAKAIQDWALYNGQEASTRYLDMSKQEVLNPLANEEGLAIQNTWMELYKETLATLIPWLAEQFPRQPDQDEKVHTKAIAAKAFDIARGFLPAGITTLLSWHTNLRQAHDHLKELEHHPLQEIRDIAQEIRSGLQSKYPSSFSHKTYSDQEAFLDQVAMGTYYHNPNIRDFKYTPHLRVDALCRDHHALLLGRPQKTELPRKLTKYGDIVFQFPLDFGSFRDIQRHRSGVCEMPLLTTELGFLPWYLEQLPEALLQKALKIIDLQKSRISKLTCDQFTKQYYIAMGFAVSCEFTLGLPASVYIAELRSSQTVHPTLRVIAQQMGKALKEIVPKIALYCDNSSDSWNIKRGTQDIVRK